MIFTLYVLAYLFIGWVVASICLILSIRNHPKRAPEDEDFIVPFFLWWLALIGIFIYCVVEATLWLGRKTTIFITKNMKGKTK